MGTAMGCHSNTQTLVSELTTEQECDLASQIRVFIY